MSNGANLAPQLIKIDFAVFPVTKWLPPLDGSKILSNFLPYKAREWFESREQIFYIIFVAIWVTGLAGTIISPLINEAYRGLTYIMAKMFKII